MGNTTSSTNFDTFRQNSKHGQIPSKSSLNEGLFGEYYFKVGDGKPVQELVKPFSSVGKAQNLLTGQIDKYLGVALLSSEDGKNYRDDSNICVVLDISGSMLSYMLPQEDESIGQPGETNGRQKTKLEIAVECLLEIYKNLRPQETLCVVLFDTQAELLLAPTRKADIDDAAFTAAVLAVKARGGTTMRVGLEMAVKQIKSLLEKQKQEGQELQNNRILFLTDANPNTTETKELIALATRACKMYTYITYIGVGLDFDTALVNQLIAVKGTNYFSVHSQTQFKKILVEDFNYVVTPVCFEIELSVDSAKYDLSNVYGVAKNTKNSNTLVRTETLMGSAINKQGLKGSLILIRLKEKEPSADPLVNLTLTYTKKNGEKVNQTFSEDVDKSLAELEQQNGAEDMFTDEGTRKGVVLATFMDVMEVILDEAATKSATHYDTFLPEVATRELAEKCKAFILNESENYVFDHNLKKEMTLLDDFLEKSKKSAEEAPATEATQHMV